MDIVPTNMTVADYCSAMDRGEIIVNRDYQRSDKVWPPIARATLPGIPLKVSDSRPS